MHLHHAMLSTSINNEDEYNIHAQVIFCDEEQIFTMEETQIVSGVTDTGSVVKSLELLTTVLLELLKRQEIEGRMMRAVESMKI